MMTVETFRSLVDDLVSAGERPIITLAWSGEPTLNKVLPDMVAYASANGFTTILSTNAQRLTADIAMRLVDARLTTATMCMDGFDAKAHETYRIGSKIETVKANIEQFVRINRERGGKTVCQLQTLLTAYSEPQLDDIVAWAKQIGIDVVSLKTFSLSLDGKNDETGRNKFLHYLPRALDLRRDKGKLPAKTLCTVPLSQSVIYWNGNLGLCCIDMDADVKMPSILDTGFTALLKRRDVQRSRKAGFLKQHKICDGCTLGAADEVTRKIPLNPA
jgi:MoaA/NifB/PqqE/SkfB family radical SAM enzyme